MSDLGIVKSRMKLKADRGRKWRPTNGQITVVGILLVHLLVVFAPFTFTWPAFWVTVGLSVIGQLFGISLSYHRNLSHQSFKLPKWLEYFFVIVEFSLHRLLCQIWGIVKSRMKLKADRGRKWRPTNGQITVVGILLVHLLVVFAPFTFTWPAFWVTVGLSVIGQLFGISVSYHRNLSHQSFKLPKWLEYFFAYCGVLAAQGDPIFWVTIHRYHHQFVDTEKDPHSPIHGFWFSQMGWIFHSPNVFQTHKGRKNVEDLKKQPFYLFLRKTYCGHLLALAFLLYALGGFPFLVWGEGVRIFYHFHSTSLVNSVCHLWGKQAWKTDDLSKNNGFIALLTFGEGWHNNHHAFESSARHGLEWWQFDPAWYVVRFLETTGLATNVKLPTEAQKKKKSFE